MNFSGSYKSKHCGTGWQIKGDYGIPTKDEADVWIKQLAPQWATNGEKVLYTTPEQHLAVYAKRSGYSVFVE